MAEQSQQVTTLRARINATETPSKKDGLIKQQTEQIRALQQKMQKFEQERDVELDSLEQQLDTLETANAKLQQKADRLHSLEVELEAARTESAEHQRRIDRLNERAQAADRDQSVLGHQGDELKAKQTQIEELEDELDQLQVKFEHAVEQRRVDVAALEHELQEARASGDARATELQQNLTQLRATLESDHLESKQLLEDEILVLETTLDDLQAEKATFEARIRELEEEVHRRSR